MGVEKVGNKFSGQVFSIKSKKPVGESGGKAPIESRKKAAMEIRNQMNEVVFSADIVGVGFDEDNFLIIERLESDGTIKREMFILGATYFVRFIDV